MSVPVVTRVSIQYNIDGKPFRLDLPSPELIDAIVFGRKDFERLTSMQNAVAAVSSVPRAKEHFLEATRSFRVTAEDGTTVLAVSASTDGASDSPTDAVEIDNPPTDALTAARSLWWHTTTCNWFHPVQT